MNILPKKSWHVRSRDNIARVKRDEAQAAEEEKEKEARIALAEQEARTEKLRIKARNKNLGNTSHGFDQEVIGPQPLPDVAITGAPTSQTLPRTHINFFSEIESGSNTKTSNKDHEAEKKQEQEAYEKKIGLLVGLGQSAIESQTVKPWYQQKREEDKTTDATSTDTNEMKRKASMDPMNDMLRYLGKKPKTLPDAQTSIHQHPPKGKDTQPKGGLPGTSRLMSMFSKYKNKSREEENGKEDTSHRRHREKKRKKHRKLKERKRDSRRHSHKKSSRKHSKHSRHYSDSSSSESEDTRREARLSRRGRKSHKRDIKHNCKSSRVDSNSGSDSGSQSFSSTGSDESDKQKSKVSAKPTPTIEQLRAERLRREAAERTKTERFLAGKPLVEQPAPEMITDKLDGKYNSQFNPHLARKHQPKEPMF